jgi:hypothetical protein
MRALVSAIRDTGDIPPAAVMVDGPAYDIEWPENWKIYQSDDHLEMQKAINILFENHPNEPWYGLLADHARPKSANWSKKLSEVADAGKVAVAECNKKIINPRTSLPRLSITCWPGDLIRAMGWFWLPSVVHLYGDDALDDIAYGLGLVEYVSDVQVNDLLRRDGDVPIDENHKRIWREKSYMESDRQAYIAWRRKMYPQLIENLREKLCLPLPV